MIAFATEAADLLAGDVVGSGPLARTSSDGRRSLRDGDTITAEVAGVGRMTGVIVTSKRTSRYL
jgi:2-keto-4-pentenoate hydratase/2-oxohepta-3-ene-1,7-dioic acid hydratase in catechol pathway